MQRFSYDLAFDRNLGWLTEPEQQALRFKRVAIAGMGGVGGVHLATLARLGVGAFHIADLDSFELANFNRQYGATIATIDRPKAEVMEEMARGINPELRIRRFDHGIDEANLDAFLAGVDLFVDGFDFFVLDIRRKVYARCRELGIPAVCAAPIGMGVGFLAFVPGGMSFDEYFRLEGISPTDQYVRFLVGLVPRTFHTAYLMDRTRADFRSQRAPSTGASCQLCAGVAAVAAAKLLLRRGGVRAAPWHHHYDPYVGKLALTRLRWGNAGPVQRLKAAVARRMLVPALDAPVRVAEPPPRTAVEEILRAARWAPSGDNTQPWRFEMLGAEQVRVLLRTEPGNPYEYRDGEPTLLAGGALLESLRVAASGWGRTMRWQYRGGTAGGEHRIDVTFAPDGPADPDPWLPWLTLRSVDRRAYRARPLTGTEKAALAAAAGPAVAIEWREARGERLALARLGMRATDIRLRAPETYPVHRRVVDFARVHSPEGIPARAVGLDRGTVALMRWAMRRWPRMRTLNALGGSWTAAAQLDLLPGLGSAAFLAVRPAAPLAAEGPARAEQLLGIGAAIQRLWLEATRRGLAMQPALATLCFAGYGAAGTPFTADQRLARKAAALAGRFRQVLGRAPDEIVFLARIGEPRGRDPRVRSVRLPLGRLLAEPPADTELQQVLQPERVAAL